MDDDDIVHYASLIGNAQALKSIYAMLIKGTKEVRAPGYNRSDLRGKRPYCSWSKKLPNTTYTHMVILRDSERLLLATDARGAALIAVEHRDRRRDLRDDAQSELAGRLLAYLRDHTDLPVLPAWTETLWRQTESDWNLAEPLSS